MKLTKTKDNSYTFFNEKYQEAYHSLTGALEEAQKKYIEPLGVKDGQVILDICFGLGYNTFAAIEKAKHLKVIALEIDEEILKELQSLEINNKYNIIKKIAREKYYKDKNYEITLLLGPAQETIKTIKETFDIVFLDPFSPKKNPELWTKEFFQEIFNRMKPGAKLATYSCARAVRENLKEVGFIVTDGPSVKRRGPSTIAEKPSL
ncbi:MAG: MnmC family methyltransferase [bacterium]|nr:MnmC family methyltransferase [bacterium]